MTEVKQYYKLIDIARLFCALLIVLIHMGIDENTYLYSIIPNLSRQGVPFFFIVSGFFFTKKFTVAKNKKIFTVNYIKPIITAYFIWVLLWLPYIIKEYITIYTGSSSLKIVAVICRRIFVTGYVPFWYLLCLAEGLLLLTAILKYKKYILGIILCAIGIALYVIYDLSSYFGFSSVVYDIFNFVFSGTGNVIMQGFPLVFLGALAHYFEKKSNDLNVLISLLSISL